MPRNGDDPGYTRVQLAKERTGRMLQDVERSRTSQQPLVVEVLPEDETPHGVPNTMLVQRFTVSLHRDEEVQVSTALISSINGAPHSCVPGAGAISMTPQGSAAMSSQPSSTEASSSTVPSSAATTASTAATSMTPGQKTIQQEEDKRNA